MEIERKNVTYPTRKIGDVIELRYGKGIARYERDDKGKFPIYGANGVLGWTNKALASGEAIIIGRKGSAGELIRVSGGFWPSDVTYYVIGNNKVNIDYLFYFLKSRSLPKLAVGVKPGINRNRVYEIEIPLPPVEWQRKIVDRIEIQFSKIDEARRLRAESQELTSKLLSVANQYIYENGNKHGWKERKLGDVCDVQSGGTPKKGVEEYWENGDIPWLRSEACRDGVVNKAQFFISKEGLKHSSAKLLKPRTTLIALVGATIGRTGFLTIRSTTNQNIAGLYPKDEQKILPEFLFVAVRNLYSYFLRIGKGKFKMANLGFVKNLNIQVPPLAEQKKIVSRLDALSEKVRELQKLQSETARDLDALKQSILHKAFQGEL